MDGCTKARVESTASSTELPANRRHVFASVHGEEWHGGFGILELFFRHRPICCAIADNLSRAVGRQMRVTQTNYFSPPSCGLGSAYETSATRGGEGAGRRVAVVLCPFAPEARFRTQCYCLVRLKQLCSEHWNLLSDP